MLSPAALGNESSAGCRAAMATRRISGWCYDNVKIIIIHPQIRPSLVMPRC